MTDSPTHSEQKALRALAALGGRAKTEDLKERDDLTTTTHLYRLREKGYVDSREFPAPDCKGCPHVWWLTDDGLEVVHDEASAWMDAEQTVEGAEVEP